VDKDNSELPLRDSIKKAALCLLVISFVSVSDQLSKLWVRANLVSGESLIITDRLSLINIENTGSAFGLLANQTFLIITISVAGVLFILLFLRYLSPATALSIVSVGLILGGAVGNLIDRIRFGYVTDFVDVRLWRDFHWPAFNVADSAITVGSIMLAVFIFLTFRKGDGSSSRARS